MMAWVLARYDRGLARECSFLGPLRARAGPKNLYTKEANQKLPSNKTKESKSSIAGSGRVNLAIYDSFSRVARNEMGGLSVEVKICGGVCSLLVSSEKLASPFTTGC
jgi:hypothetical protein